MSVVVFKGSLNRRIYLIWNKVKFCMSLFYLTEPLKFVMIHIQNRSYKITDNSFNRKTQVLITMSRKFVRS